MSMSNSSEETRPLKRRKTLEEEPNDDSDSSSSLSSAPESDVPNAEWTRHAQYYFDDGSIVLLAEGTIFRVHKGILTLHSGFFERLLNQPREPGAEMVDGCPLVPLQDSVGRVETLLDVMYKGGTNQLLYQPNRIFAEIQRFDAKNIDTLYQLSYIGHTYDIQSLQDYIYQQLRQTFPPQTCYLYHLLRYYSAPDFRNDLCRMVTMIRSWIPQATHLLPIVFYCYCQPRPAGAAALVHEGPERLSQADIEMCRSAIPQLVAHKINGYNVFTALELEQDLPCRSRSACRTARLKLSHDVMNRDDIATLPNPLEDLTKWCSKQPPWKNLCASCAKGVEKEIKRLREATWKDLGKIFNIPDWQVETT